MEMNNVYKITLIESYLMVDDVAVDLSELPIQVDNTRLNVITTRVNKVINWQSLWVLGALF